MFKFSMVDEQAVVPAAFLVLVVTELVASFELDLVDQLRKKTQDIRMHFKKKTNKAIY